MKCKKLPFRNDPIEFFLFENEYFTVKEILSQRLVKTICRSKNVRENKNEIKIKNSERAVKEVGTQTETESYFYFQNNKNIKSHVCEMCKRGSVGLPMSQSLASPITPLETVSCTIEVKLKNKEFPANLSSSTPNPVSAPPPPPPPPPLPLQPPPPPPQNLTPNPPTSLKTVTTAPIASETEVPLPPPPHYPFRQSTTTIQQAKSTVPPPPPPSQQNHKNFAATMPAPLPMPPTNGPWFQNLNCLRKNAICPPLPMKPLYWTRILTPKPVPKAPILLGNSQLFEPSSGEKCEEFKELWQEIDEISLDNIGEFTDLFSRQTIVPKQKAEKKKVTCIKAVKVLDSKRSQNVGILSRSLHVDFSEIEYAIYHVDTSVVSLDTLQQIISVKATEEELKMIIDASQGDYPLDGPEQFLLNLSRISMSTERMSCIVFQVDFEETMALIFRKVDVIRQVSRFLIENQDLKMIFSIILTLGNFMNGGNRNRGQADGFTLEILGKLKDVKSKDPKLTLLHFVVQTYIRRRRNEGIPLLEIPFPIPEPCDIEQSMKVDFEEVKANMANLKRKLNDCEKTAEKVIRASCAKTLQPFKDKMEELIKISSQSLESIGNDFKTCQELFIRAMRFYHFVPKRVKLEEATPEEFFQYWMNFTIDFKDIWKKEIAKLWNDLLKKSKQIQTHRRNSIVKTTKLKPGGLKERIMRLSSKK